jgi:DNA-binding response OmpR family regulator
MSARRVLVVEDEPTIAEAVAARLRADGFLVEVAADGPSAVAAALARRPDLVVLDVMLPGFDGLEVCRRVQARHEVPVLMLTARDDETDMLVGLGVGADDYLTKPFSMRELLARVHAVLRRFDRAAARAAAGHGAPAGSAGFAEPGEATGRTGTAAQDGHRVIRLGDLEIDEAERRVRRAGAEVHLTPTEFDLLVCFADRPRTVLTRERLLAEVWDWADASGTRTVDSHVKALRRKLGADLFRTVHGVGYALESRLERR